MKFQDSRKLEPSEGRVKKKRKNCYVTANVVNCKYELVKSCIEGSGIKILDDESSDLSSAFLIWHDSVVPFECFQGLKAYQHINHFPSMGEICRKDSLARNMMKMKRARADEFNFMPRTWNMPSEYSLLLLHAKDANKSSKKTVTYIQKPANGAMGNGIQLFRNPEKIQPTDHTIVQEYLDKPLLLDGFKIDLRLYVLVTNCDPLRIFLYQDGLVRLGTEKYVNPSENNMNQRFMHLTNYSINKQNKKFERHSDFDRGSKRSIKSLIKYLRNAGYDTTTLWQNISDVIVKTLIVASPHLLHSYRMCRPGQTLQSGSACFEILGFDIFLDTKLKPWLLEINRAPSFGGDEKIDQDIKGGVLEDALRLINIKASDKRRDMAQQKTITQRRLFTPSRSQMTPGNVSATEQRKALISQRKQQLKEKLVWVRKEAAKEEFEDANMRGYQRIYPCHDRKQTERYASLLAATFKMFQSHCSPTQRNEHYRPESEDKLLDLIEQCEIEEGFVPKAAKSLSSMPTLTPRESSRQQACFSFATSSSSDSSSEDDRKEFSNAKKKTLPPHSRSRPSLVVSSPSSNTNKIPPRVQHELAMQTKTSDASTNVYKQFPLKSRNHFTTRTSLRQISTPSLHERDPRHRQQRVKVLSAMMKRTRVAPPMLSGSQEAEQLQQALNAFQQTRIKFPGKTDKEAEDILDNIMKNWKYHKPRVAYYWLVELDSIKRQKVINIVRRSVRVVMQRVWKGSQLDTLHLTRSINRVFNRLHWSHGQGLWNCFTTSSNSWETIFSKSTDTVSSVELECCRRVVNLCQDCLLIVYRFANDVSDHLTKSEREKRNLAPTDMKHFQRYGHVADLSPTLFIPKLIHSTISH